MLAGLTLTLKSRALCRCIHIGMLSIINHAKLLVFANELSKINKKVNKMKMRIVVAAVFFILLLSLCACETTASTENNESAENKTAKCPPLRSRGQK